MSAVDAPGTVVSLRDATDPTRFGGKASQLGEAIRAGLPVPPGFACDWAVVASIAAGDGWAARQVDAMYEALGGAVVVRSSAIGEDSAGASFAGQHLTVVNVRSAEAVVGGIVDVHESAATNAALAYRERLHLPAVARMAVVVQRLVVPTCAGVLFTRDPLTGEDVRVIEASWGLGETVVAGMVTPDRFRLARGGAIIEATIGVKDVRLQPADLGGTEEVPVEPERIAVACLDPGELEALDALATACERAWQGGHDLEWAIAGSTVLLLQRRPITGLAV